MKSIGGNIVMADVTLSVTTGIHASGDVLADVQEVTRALHCAGGSGYIESLVVVDGDDQGAAMDVIFFDGTATLGTENSAVSITDANAAKIIGIVSVLASDYVDLINSKVAFKEKLGILVDLSTGTSIYVGTVTRGTPTHSASGITLRIGIVQD